VRDDTFHWLDVERIAEELALHHPDVDPLAVSFPQLRDLVAGLPGFTARPGHPANEKILETIQSLWHEERGDDDRD
jgi:FeS assembly protein IscX